MSTTNRAAGLTCRRTFLATGAALIAAPAVGSAQSLTKLRLGATLSEDILSVLWAQQSGIFARYGLDVEVQHSNNGAAVSAAVLSGALELGKGSILNILTAHAHGAPLVLEAPSSVYTSTVRNAALLVAKDSPIHTGRDFNGKTLAVAALGDMFALGTSAWIDRNGGDARTVKFLEMPGSAQADAVAAGRVDGAMMADPLVTDAVKSGKCRLLAYAYDAIAPRFAVTLYFAAADYAAKNADVMARFRKGVAEGAAYATAHRAETLPALAKFTGIDLAVLSKSVPNVMGVTLDPRLIQPVIDVAVQYGVLAKSFPAKELFDPNA